VAEPRLLPEQRARQRIDALLRNAGWVVQDMAAIDLAANRGVAVREFPTATGPTDYLLFVDRKAVGTVEAKKEGETLLGVETQADRYSAGFAETVKTRPVPYVSLPLPVHYLTTGVETLFTSRRDPAPRPREVFAFHRPETLLEWAQVEHPLRARLRQMPPVSRNFLHPHQIDAIEGLEESLRADRPRALVDMTMGSGKTFVAVDEAYRLLRFAGATRLLFLVDRINLGQQAEKEFKSYVSPDDGRKFSELYNVQLLRSNRIDPAAQVVITTIQRLYSILRGQSDAEFDPATEEESFFDTQAGVDRDEQTLPIEYQPPVPIETFDFVFTDECHRSIYGKWGQVLDYFDAFLTGLTATPSKFTYAYFNGNVVAEYTHEQSVIDGINVDYTVYRIDTEITRHGSTIEAGEWVRIRDRFSRTEALRELDDEVTYDQAKLDRTVSSPDQIRTVIRTFRDKVQSEIFPGRTEVPKTVFFCKTDAHADDVLKIIREEFSRGSDFARKITYKTQGSSLQHIQDFRTDPSFRIAVTVDQVSTGTDIKAIECLVFLRMVGSRALFEQMKGRGVRRMNQDEFWAVTPGAREHGVRKDHFVIVDCVGITDEDRAWAETKPLDRQPTVPLKRLLQDVALGAVTTDLVSTLGARLKRLENKLSDEDLTEFARLAGQSMRTTCEALIDAAKVESAIALAGQDTGETPPTSEQIDGARQELALEATKTLSGPVRSLLLDLQQRSEIVIDLSSQDRLLAAGFVDTGEAEQITHTFKQWIGEHRDEYAALEAYFERPYRRRLGYDDIKALARAIEKPPLNLTREKLWAAYKKLDESKVRGEGGRVLTDIVSLVRFALGADEELVPHVDVVRLRYDLWIAEQMQNGRSFTAEQARWLEMVRDHIATSMTIETEDFDLEPFVEEGGLNGAFETFGDDLTPLLEELNETLGAA
jgi:type I restriction enzyme R subunit